ncbi:hypothetical protein M885DRAFT_263265 [Pelagophyceae sp. CCMP2097]|nr:hypothetical protein M885DRAFT_263265 [Pelagophyceae sp. CCMP2097]
MTGDDCERLMCVDDASARIGGGAYASRNRQGEAWGGLLDRPYRKPLGFSVRQWLTVMAAMGSLIIGADRVLDGGAMSAESLRDRSVTFRDGASAKASARVDGRVGVARRRSGHERGHGRRRAVGGVVVRRGVVARRREDPALECFIVVRFHLGGFGKVDLLGVGEEDGGHFAFEPRGFRINRRLGRRLPGLLLRDLGRRLRKPGRRLGRQLRRGHGRARRLQRRRGRLGL